MTFSLISFSICLNVSFSVKLSLPAIFKIANPLLTHSSSFVLYFFSIELITVHHSLYFTCLFICPPLPTLECKLQEGSALETGT